MIGWIGLIFFIIIVVSCCFFSDNNSSSNNTTKSSTSTLRRTSTSTQRNNYSGYCSYFECPSCGAPYYDGYCDECGYPDTNQGWLGENY